MSGRKSAALGPPVVRDGAILCLMNDSDSTVGKSRVLPKNAGKSPESRHRMPSNAGKGRRKGVS